MPYRIINKFSGSVTGVPVEGTDKQQRQRAIRMAAEFLKKNIPVIIRGSDGFERHYEPRANWKGQQRRWVSYSPCPICRRKMDSRAETCRKCYTPTEHPLHMAAIEELNEKRRANSPYEPAPKGPKQFNERSRLGSLVKEAERLGHNLGVVHRNDATGAVEWVVLVATGRLAVLAAKKLEGEGHR